MKTLPPTVQADGRGPPTPVLDQTDGVILFLAQVGPLIIIPSGSTNYNSLPRQFKLTVADLPRFFAAASHIEAGYLGLPRTLQLTPYTLHHALYTLHPTPYTLHPTPYTLRPTPYALHPTPYILHPTPHAQHPTPSTLHRGYRAGRAEFDKATRAPFSARGVSQDPHLQPHLLLLRTSSATACLVVCVCA